MDRRQVVVQRAREFFGERIDDVVHMIRQDRQDLRGWQEPAHVRAVVRRTVVERAGGEPTSSVAVNEAEFARGAGEPDRGQQREVLGHVFEAGACGLEKVARNVAQEISPEETFGLECVLLFYGRPSLLVSEGKLASVPPFWNVLEDQREDIEMAQRGVGRIELFGHPEYDWAGTGFLINEATLLTTRRTAEIFAEERSGQWQFRPGITTWMDYRSSYQGVASAGYRVRNIYGVHPTYDLALLEVEPPQVNDSAPMPLAITGQAPQRLEGRPVYLVGYPVRDARRNEPEPIARVFRDVYNVKRVQPGCLRSCMPFQSVQLLQHDCGPLGQSSGGCLFDLETHQVLGLQLCSRYLEMGTAIPLWVMRDDPLFRRAGVNFAEASGRDLESTTTQLERLARSRYWNEVRAAIGNYYQRAFGSGSSSGFTR